MKIKENALFKIFSDPDDVTFEKLPMAFAVLTKEAAHESNLTLDDLLTVMKFMVLIENSMKQYRNRDTASHLSNLVMVRTITS